MGKENSLGGLSKDLKPTACPQVTFPQAAPHKVPHGFSLRELQGLHGVCVPSGQRGRQEVFMMLSHI